MTWSKRAKLIWAVCLLSLLAVRAEAQSEAGVCAGVQGTVEVQRDGQWEPASIGSPVFVGDRIRTGAQSRVAIVLRDDSVLNVAPNSHLALATQEFDESARHYRSLVELAHGKVRVWVSAYYEAPRARFEVETPTAVVLVRGTQFIATYDDGADLSEVVGIAGEVEVNARLAVMGAGVKVGKGQWTRVPRGKFPTPQQTIEAAHLAQHLQGVDLVGTGRRDGLNVLHPAVVGRVLAPQDVPGAGPVPGVDEWAPRPDQGQWMALRAPAPGSVADSLSPDVYANTQPLPVYRAYVGAARTGGVRVEF